MIGTLALLLGLPVVLLSRLTSAPSRLRAVARAQIAVVAGIFTYLLVELAQIAKPIRPGTVIQFEGQQAPRILPSAAATVAIPIIHDSGPINTAVLVTSFQDFTTRYGDSDTAGRTAVAGAFSGQSLPGLPGAGGVLVWRMATAAAAVATISINAAGAGGVPTLRLDAKYEGVRGNRIGYTVDADPADATRDRLRIYFDGVLRETFIYAAPALAALAAAINSRSQLVNATALVADAAPALRLLQTAAGAAPTPLAGGNNGDAVTATEHLAAMNGIAFKPFGVISPYDVTDPAIQASYRSWVQSQAQASRPCRLVIGGAAADTVDTAIARSTTMGDEHVINVGVGTYQDDLLDKVLSTSQLAPRVAGILAAKGQQHSITFSELGGIHAITGPADDEIESLILGGVVCLSPTDSTDADLHIEKGVTTYTGDSATKPNDVFSDARLIGIMDTYERNMKQWGDKFVIGELPVNDDTRNQVYGEARRLQDDLLSAGLILPADATQVPPIPDPWVVVPVSQDDTIPYQFGWRFARTANNILGEGTVL